MVYQTFFFCTAALSLHAIFCSTNQKTTQGDNDHLWIQITDEYEKRLLYSQAQNKIVNSGTSTSQDKKICLTLTRYDLTIAASFYCLTLRDTKTNTLLLVEEFEHTQQPELFFTQDNKPVIKLGNIFNIWDHPPQTLSKKESSCTLL